MVQKISEPQSRFMYYRNMIKGIWEPFVKPLSCKKSLRYHFQILAAGTVFNQPALTFDGDILTRYLLVCGDTTNDVTRTPSIINENGVTVWAGAAHADNANYSIPVDVELVGTYTFRLTLSGAAGNIVSDYLTLFLR